MISNRKRRGDHSKPHRVCSDAVLHVDLELLSFRRVANFVQLPVTSASETIDYLVLLAHLEISVH
jgi:hypothetical protein